MAGWWQRAGRRVGGIPGVGPKLAGSNWANGPRPWVTPSGTRTMGDIMATGRRSGNVPYDRTVRDIRTTSYIKSKPTGPRIPLRSQAKSGYRAVERASMRIPARRFVLGGAAVVGAGYVMNKMMNRRKDQFYTHYYDY